MPKIKVTASKRHLIAKLLFFFRKSVVESNGDIRIFIGSCK